MPPKPNPPSPSHLTAKDMPPNPSAATDLTAKSRVDGVPAGFPATELIERCLKLIAATVSPIPRDVHTIGQVFSRASSVYEGVLALIRQIESTAVADLDIDWAPFDAYTIAIPQLERWT